MYQTNSYFVFVLYLLYSNFSMAKTHQRKPQSHQNKHTTQRKQNLSKQNSLQKSDLDENLWNSKNSEKLGQCGKLEYQSRVKNSEQKHVSVIYENYFRECISFCFFSKIKQLLPRKILKACLAQTLTKTQKTQS